MAKNTEGKGIPADLVFSALPAPGVPTLLVLPALAPSVRFTLTLPLFCFSRSQAQVPPGHSAEVAGSLTFLF